MTVDELFEKGFAARCDGRYGEAKLFFMAVLAQDPAHAQAQWQQGLIQGFEGDFDASYETLLRLSNQHPANNDLRYDLAMTMMMLAMNDEACAEFQRILDNDPTHEKANQQIVYCP
jgi:tetratricopeptide (TPR) repeat protein